MPETKDAPLPVEHDQEDDNDDRDGDYVERTIELPPEIHTNRSDQKENKGNGHTSEQQQQQQQQSLPPDTLKIATSTDDEDFEMEKKIQSDSNLIVIEEKGKKLSDTESVVRQGPEIQPSSKSKSDAEGDRSDLLREVENDDVDSIPPALPPRPPRPRQPCTCTCGLDETVDPTNRNDRRMPRSCWSSGLRKYVFFCTACGSLSILLGALFLTVYFMLKSYTSSLNHFETIPTYVPSGMLVATGFLIICLAWRKNRNNFLMKLCGLCSLCCAVLCVSVTVTTTVIHMNRLQTLRECLYTQKTQSCTCYSMMIDNNRLSDEGIKFVFNSTPDCEVIHGALYSCLRAIFGLSVIGILVCIFGCMLVYQLLSHEKKKMYWAQLEMRCRYLYRQQRNPHYYACCDECRYPPHPQLFPWELMRNRFWSTARIGNLYTPNPEDRGNHNRLRSGWNWRRLPWSRNSGGAGGLDVTGDPTRTNLGSPDSQYGFSSTIEGAPYTVLDPRTASGIPVCPPGIAGADITEGGFYSWGPPPPYASNRNSANNSPARRSLGELLNHVSPVRRNDNVSPARSTHHVHRHHVHHTRRCSSSPRQASGNTAGQQDSYQKSSAGRNPAVADAAQQEQPIGMNPMWSNSLSSVHRFQKIISNKDNYENMYESELNSQSNGFNTLPSLKKKNQTRVNEVFANEPFTAYYFSSADNLGCSTSNMGPQSISETDSLPPRVSLTNDQPSIPCRPGPSLEAVVSNMPPELETSNDSRVIYDSELNTTEGRRAIRSTDETVSLVKKLLSPSKSKHKNSLHETLPYLLEKKLESGMATPKKSGHKISGDHEGLSTETSNENAITLHYRVGIPRSPNVQNFGQLPEKTLGPLHWANSGGKEGNGSETRVSGSEKSQTDKTSKGVKYLVKDIELLQKHNSLINEFKTLDLRKNLKCKDNKLESRNTSEIENVPYHHGDDVIGTFQNVQQNVSGSHSGKILESRHGKSHYSTNGPDSLQTDEYQTGNINESDIYFGGSSDSSCYALEPLHNTESHDDANHISRYASGNPLLLNKQILKAIDSDNSKGKQHTEVTIYKRHQQNQYRAGNQYPEDRSRENSADNVGFEKQENCGKHQRRAFAGGTHPVEPRMKYFTSVSGRGFPEPCSQSGHRPETVNSADELSSTSQTTADSGVSTGRNIPKRFDKVYHELEYRPTMDCEAGSRDSTVKTAQFEGLTDFAHPLFQKPKIVAKSHRHTPESDSGQEKKSDVEGYETGNEFDGVKSQKLRGRIYSSGRKTKNYEAVEKMSGQLLAACNLGISPRSRLPEDSSHQFQNHTPKHNGNDQASVQNDEGTKKSPKPLPRTNLPNKPGAEEESSSNAGYPKSVRNLQKKEKSSNSSSSSNGSNHFLAPDAQYEFQSAYNPDTKLKSHSKHGDQVLGTRIKPPVSARPAHLQEDYKKSPGKADGINVHVTGRGNDMVRPIPRRRRGNVPDVAEGKDVEIGAHSVNV